ncbi:hypothetical protein [Mocis latipes granulovirus]|uniref:Uncharacterized protein n=1 Tax=Mocis latipes granulovirus TaxID=2072024 RepID=A0A162GWN4_9BBAC|nr:hypothetical protein [Mocis latipes granulovirus]AKR17497.1 hypothetical protein [Mocis latipes granulovirus]
MTKFLSGYWSPVDESGDEEIRTDITPYMSPIESESDDNDPESLKNYCVRSNRFFPLSTEEYVLEFSTKKYDESDRSCNSQFEDSDYEECPRKVKRVRRSASIPLEVKRYTPTMKMARVRDMGRCYFNQNHALACNNGWGVHKNFCICTGKENLGRAHMIETFAHFKKALSPKRFLYVLFSYIYLITLHDSDYILPIDKVAHEDVCNECTMIKWWLKDYNNNVSALVMYLYANYAAPQQFRYTVIVNSIERYLLKKHSNVYITCFIETLHKYLNENTAMYYVKKILYLLYRCGEEMTSSSVNFCDNQLMKLCVLCKNYKEFDDVLDAIAMCMSIPGNEFKALFMPESHIVPLKIKWNKIMAYSVLTDIYKKVLLKDRLEEEEFVSQQHMNYMLDNFYVFDFIFLTIKRNLFVK